MAHSEWEAGRMVTALVGPSSLLLALDGPESSE
jgi:hypothetical protein